MCDLGCSLVVLEL